MIRTKIHPGAAIVVTLSVAIFAFGFSNRLAEKAVEKPPTVITLQECIRCHSSDKTIMAMHDKAGSKRWASFLSTSTKGKCPVSQPHAR